MQKNEQDEHQLSPRVRQEKKTFLFKKKSKVTYYEAMNPITRQLMKLLKYFDKNQDILVLHRDLALSMLEYLQILCHNHVILKLLHKY